MEHRMTIDQLGLANEFRHIYAYSLRTQGGTWEAFTGERWVEWTRESAFREMARMCDMLYTHDNFCHSEAWRSLRTYGALSGALAIASLIMDRDAMGFPDHQTRPIAEARHMDVKHRREKRGMFLFNGHASTIYPVCTYEGLEI